MAPTMAAFVSVSRPAYGLPAGHPARHEVKREHEGVPHVADVHAAVFGTQVGQSAVASQSRTLSQQPAHPRQRTMSRHMLSPRSAQWAGTRRRRGRRAYGLYGGARGARWCADRRGGAARAGASTPRPSFARACAAHDQTTNPQGWATYEVLVTYA